jgi:integrase/recombinase XerD
MSLELAATLAQWLDEFLEDMRRRNYSPRSLRCYRYDLLHFVGWVGEQPELATPGHLTLSALEQYQMHLMLRPSRKSPLQTQPLSAAARNRQLAVLRSFFRYLKKACKLLSNPSVELENARQLRRLPQAILTKEEMAQLLEAIPKETAVGLRDWAAVELLYSAGLRRLELLSLDLEALRLGEELVHVLGKGNKERVVPIGQAAGRALERYLREGRPQLVEGNHRKVFASKYHGGPVSQQELLDSIRHHAQRAKISRIQGYHQFRHTCATHMLRGGADLRSIQALLGHSDLNSTAIYTKVEISDLRKTLKECHPREKDFPEPA